MKDCTCGGSKLQDSAEPWNLQTVPYEHAFNIYRHDKSTSITAYCFGQLLTDPKDKTVSTEDTKPETQNDQSTETKQEENISNNDNNNNNQKSDEVKQEDPKPEHHDHSKHPKSSIFNSVLSFFKNKEEAPTKQRRNTVSKKDSPRERKGTHKEKSHDKPNHKQEEKPHKIPAEDKSKPSEEDKKDKPTKKSKKQTKVLATL